MLILVDKGRMGVTFPQSFDCLDLRLSYDSKPLYLSTVIQELGRMCRYANVSVGESRAQNLPYVLVGRELFKELQESLKTSRAIISSISRISNANKIDRYMTRQTGRKVNASSSLRWLDYEASRDSFDHENQERHRNRILLQVEPQIGKTGTYSCLIKLLRLAILGKEKVASTTNGFDEGTFYLHKQCDSSEEPIINEEKQEWQFPYWKTIQDSPSLCGKAVAEGKYSIGGCSYTHDTEETPLTLMKRGQLKPTKLAYSHQRSDCEDSVRAWHWYHFETCPECVVLLDGEEPVLGTIEVNIDDEQITIRCSLPASGLRYSKLREQLSSSRSRKEGWTERSLIAAMSNVPTLPYLIFHPSHRDDPRKCLLNYNHVMREKGPVANYVQVAVVRSEQFEAYRATWGKVLAIFQLPDKLPSFERGPGEGGVGYARLFIQRTAFALNLEYVFVIDDNVAMMNEAVFRRSEQTGSTESVERENDVMKTQHCSFLKPLAYLTKIADGKEIPPIVRHAIPVSRKGTSRSQTVSTVRLHRSC